MSHITKHRAKLVGEFIDSRGPAGATASDIRLYCKVGGASLSKSKVERSLAYLWQNGWMPAGKSYRVTRTRVGGGPGARYVMGTHATRQLQDNARLERMLEGITRSERDARQADIILEQNPTDMTAMADRSGSLQIRHQFCSQIRMLLARNPQYTGVLSTRRGWMPGATLLDDVMST